MKKIVEKSALGILFVAVLYGVNLAFFLMNYPNFFLGVFFIASVFFLLLSKQQFTSLVIFLLGALSFLFYVFLANNIAYSTYRFGIDLINIFNVILVGLFFLRGFHKKLHKNINIVPVFLLILFAFETIFFSLYNYHSSQSYPLIDILNSNIKRILKEVSSIYNIASLKNNLIFNFLIISSLVLQVIFQIFYILIALHIGIAFSKNSNIMLNYKNAPFSHKVFRAYNVTFLFFILLYVIVNRTPFLTSLVGSKNILIFQIFALASFAIYGIIGFSYISKSWLKNNILLFALFVFALFIFTIYAFLFIMLLGFLISWRIYLTKEF